MGTRKQGGFRDTCSAPVHGSLLPIQNKRNKRKHSYNGTLLQLLSGQTISEPIEHAVLKAASDFRFFHWHLRFGEVMEQGGFDCVLGNPPWERIKLQEKEFFEKRSDAIAKASNKALRGKLIKALQSPEASETDKALLREFSQKKRDAECKSEFFRGSNRYLLTASGDLNTYPLFTEASQGLTHQKGRTGIIIPSGIATDYSNRNMFQSLIKRKKLISFLGFDNALKVFPSVHPDTPFALVTLGDTKTSADICHYILSCDQLSDSRRIFSIDQEEVKIINPNTFTAPIFRTQMDANITKKIYKNSKVLVEDSAGEEGNLWNLNIHSRLFHMSEDSHLFSKTLHQSIYHSTRPSYLIILTTAGPHITMMALFET